MRRLPIILGVALAAVVATVGVAVVLLSGEDQERFAVQWESIEVSPDRQTVTVLASYPEPGFCAKQPDGVDIEVQGSVATVAAWVVGPAPRDGLDCTAECGPVTQSVTLSEPLPPEVDRFEPVPESVSGCMSPP